MNAISNEPTLERAYEILVNQIKKKPESQKKIMAHLREVTGKSIPLPLYHNEKSIDEATKKDMYKTLVKAVLNNDYSTLQGQALQGQGEQRVDPVEAAAKEKAAPPTTETPPESTTSKNDAEVESVSPKTETVNRNVIRTSTDTTLVDALISALEPHIISIVEKRLKATMANGGFPTERVQAIVNDTLKARFS